MSKGTGTLETVFGDLPYRRGRLPGHPPRHPAPLAPRPRGRADQAAGDGEPGTCPLAQAVPQRVRPADRRRALQRARHPPAEHAPHPRRARRLPDPGQAVRRAQRDHPRSPSVRRGRAGTATSIPGPSTSTTSSRSWAGCTSRRRCTRPSRATGSWSAASARGPTTSIPEAVPAPYNHSNVDSDEVLYYASSEFMSRKGIEFGSITHHPDGIPHGPHPGRAEASIGAKYTDELAVMMDSFRPLKVAEAGARDRGPELPQVAGSTRSTRSSIRRRPELVTDGPLPQPRARRPRRLRALADSLPVRRRP